MASIFISHSSRNNDLATLVARGLENAGYESVFLDIDPEQGIKAGQAWEQELHTQLRTADAVVFLATPESVESRWCSIEIALAQERRKPIFPMRMAPVGQSALLAHLHWIDFTTDSTSWLDRLVTGLTDAGVAPIDSLGHQADRLPYPGLSPFAFHDAAVFFGRDPEIKDLLRRFEPTATRERGQFVAVIGPSGSGKSSLVGAGLLPRLAKLGWIVPPPLFPGEWPSQQLAWTLSSAYARFGLVREPAALERHLVESGPRAVMQVVNELNRAAGSDPAAKVVLFVDQAEELVTRTPPAEGASFLQLLQNCLHPDCPLWIVATVRSDFLSPMLTLHGADQTFDQSVLVGPLPRARLPQVVAGPADKTGVRFEAGLVDRIVIDAVGGDALPLLAYALRHLYETSAEDGYITHDEYESAGGVDGALERQADRVLETLSRTHPREAVLGCLLQLVSIQPGGTVVRRPLRQRTLSAEQRQIFAALVDARLLRAHQTEHEPTIEISHEALLRVWRPLREAIQQSRRALEIRTEIETTAQAWDHAGREASFLPRGAFLASAADTVAATGLIALGDSAQAFLRESREAATWEVRKTRRSNRRLRILAASMAFLLVVVGVLGAITLRQSRTVQEQARIATTERLLSLAGSLVQRDPAKALRVGIAAVQVGDSSKARSALARSVSGTHFAASLEEHTDTVRGVAASPRRENLVATAGWDGKIILWDIGRLTEPRSLAILADGGQSANDVSFSPTGNLLASAGATGFALWDVSGPDSPEPVPVAGEQIKQTYGLSFSDDGRVLATSGDGGVIRLWDLTKRPVTAIATLNGSTKGTIYSVAFRPGGRWLVAAGEDKVLRVWDVRKGRTSASTSRSVPDDGKDFPKTFLSTAFDRTGETLAVSGGSGFLRLYGFDEQGQTKKIEDVEIGGSGRLRRPAVFSVAFTPTGDHLAAVTGTGRMIVWELTGGHAANPFESSSSGQTLLDVGFTRSGRRVISGGYDRRATVWSRSSMADPVLNFEATGFEAQVNGISFVGDDGLAAVTGDGRFAYWNVLRRSPLSTDDLIGAHGDEPTWGLATDGSGKVLVTGGDDKVINVWGVPPRGRLLRRLTQHQGKVWSVDVSHDGSTLVSGSADGTARVYDLTRSGESQVLEDLGEVLAVALSPDGDMVATGGSDRVITIWNVADPARPVQLGQLPGQSNDINALAYSQDGQLLASASGDGSVMLVDLSRPSNPGRMAYLSAHDGRVDNVKFSPDGKTLATASGSEGTGGDGTVRLWDISEPDQPLSVAELDLVGNSVWALAFSRDGNILATADSGHSVRLWSMRPRQEALADPVRSACAVVGKGLSEEEWAQLVPNIRWDQGCPQ